MKAVKLKTEYLKNPLGIDIKNPRFMWNCEGGKAQSAYRLIASDTRGNIIWDSGKVESSQMSFIPYPLDTTSRLRVNWKVKLWDENGLERAGILRDRAQKRLRLEREVDNRKL